MIRPHRLATCLVLAVPLLIPGLTVAHEQHNTHANLARASAWLLGNPLIDARAESLIVRGTVDEDQCPNYYSHFFNPRTGELMRNAVVPPPTDGNCSDGVNPRDNQMMAPERAAGLWNLAKARFAANDRDAAYRLLGQALHLLQDMTSPAHVHNAPHGIPLRSNCFQDSDDFETWGWCDDNGTYHILDYWDVANRRPTPRFDRSLELLFGRSPQFACSAPDPLACTRAGEPNVGYAYVRRVAELVYDFTTFPAVLVDFNFDADPQPDSELRRMFPKLRDAVGGWSIDDEAAQQNIGFTDGNCGKTELIWPGTREEWWPMENPGGGEEGPDCFIQDDIAGNNNRTSGGVYIENTGGGGPNADLAVPDNLIPHVYQRRAGGRELYRELFGTDDNLAAESGAPDAPGKRKSMLRIYGDILYPVAAVYGAGFIQAFLDEVMPPVVRVEATPDHLWPPNHKMVPVTVEARTDPPSPQAPQCSLVAITSDEISAGPGRRHDPDWSITGDLTAELRAERDGRGDGRAYTLLVDCTYGSGKDTVVALTVPVAHDRRDGTDGDDNDGEDGGSGSEGGGDRTADPGWGASPNPLQADGKIWFTLDAEDLVTLSIYDQRGRLVGRPVVARLMPAGRHEIDWNGTDATGSSLPSGVYFFRVESGAGLHSGRFILLR